MPLNETPNPPVLALSGDILIVVGQRATREPWRRGPERPSAFRRLLASLRPA